MIPTPAAAMKKTLTNWDLKNRSLGVGSCWHTDGPSKHRTWENKCAKGKSMTIRTH
jgi:hypothetical protein